MALRIVILLLLSFQFFPSIAQEGSVKIKSGKQSLISVLNHIERKSMYNIVFSDEFVAEDMMVYLASGEYPISTLLNKILSGYDLFYKELSGNLIVIGNKSSQYTLEQEQAKIRLSGNIRNADQQAISYASVSLFSGNQFLTGTTTDTYGRFHLRYAFKEGEAYSLKLSSIGYKATETSFSYPDTALFASLQLERESRLLDEVQVNAQKPAIERRADRFIVNVEGSVLENGSNGLEILQKSPGLWVNPNGAISLRGQSVLVMINDVVQRMSSTDLAEYLRTLRSEDISKIEILPNPPAEFEAESSGGIVHIILKKGREEGFVGSVNTQYRQQVERPRYGVAATLNYKIKDFYAFGSTGYEKDQSEYIATNDIHYPDQSVYNSFTDRYNNNDRAMLRLGAVYDFSANQSIGLQTNLNRGKLLQYFDTEIELTGQEQALDGLANSEWTRKPEFSSTTLNYSLKTDSLGSRLKFIADYVHSENPNINHFQSRYSDPQQDATFRNSTPSITRLFSAQTDFTQLFKNKMQFKVGAKYTSTNRDNEVVHENFIVDSWILDPGRSNRFIYKEQLMMGYASLEHKLKRTSVQLGLRAEQTIMDGNSFTAGIQFHRSYLNFFPSVFIMHELDSAKKTSLLLNYTRRLSRPSFASLNPYRLQFYDYLAQIGNPDLLPEYVNRVETGVTFGSGISFDVYFSSTDNMMAQYAQSIDKVIEYQIRNFNHSYRYGVSLFAPIKVKKWWSMTNNMHLSTLRYRIQDVDYNNTSFNVSTFQVFNIKKIGDADVFSYYRSPYLSANSDMAYQFAMDLGYTKRLFGDRGRLRLTITDVFNTAREKDITEDNGTTIYFYQKRPTRTVGLSFSYTFMSGKKFSNKKIEESAEDERKRIGN
ncbi:outer membrane beta-barrel protein [Parapedobacter tibetensis]|uniref:outer membrane beta-barrel protein n=1 Tax=Parapedobacter tibetensis TaxID=2972951 RepID=UPI00214D2123|nr:outer membrane beta-barrel protein [Parapedobacter tibetensis]